MFEYFTLVTHKYWPYLLEWAIQNTIFLTLLTGVLLIIRNKDARLLKILTRIGIIKLLIPPLMAIGGAMPRPSTLRPVVSSWSEAIESLKAGFSSGPRRPGRFEAEAILMPSLTPSTGSRAVRPPRAAVPAEPMEIVILVRPRATTIIRAPASEPRRNCRFHRRNTQWPS